MTLKVKTNKNRMDYNKTQKLKHKLKKKNSLSSMKIL